MLSNQEISKFLSFVLRHKPQEIQLNMDEQGWVLIQALIDQARRIKKVELTYSQIQQVVANNDKQRFKLSEDGCYIRANQGHSIKVDLELIGKMPPDILYHGTARRFLPAIQLQGLLPMSRQYVHLTSDQSTALSVGQRYGQPVLLSINAKAMHADAVEFFQSENGVWLVKAVLPKYFNQT